MLLQEGSSTEKRLQTMYTVVLLGCVLRPSAHVQKRHGQRKWSTQSQAPSATGQLHETGHAVLHTSLQKYKNAAAAMDRVRHEMG